MTNCPFCYGKIRYNTEVHNKNFATYKRFYTIIAYCENCGAKTEPYIFVDASEFDINRVEWRWDDTGDEDKRC